MAEHNTLSGTQLHEPKGAAAALAGEVYVANGAGSGSFQTPTIPHQHAELSLGETTNNAVATSVPILDAYVPVLGTWVENHVHIMTTDILTGKLIVDTAGGHFVSADVSVISSRSNAILAFRFLVNGIAIGGRIRRKNGVGVEVGALSIHSILPGLLASDEIQLGVTYLTGEGGIAGDTVTVENCILTATLIEAT